MQVILMEKVPNLGNLGDVVTVKDGYARNYLIPQGKAKRATPENIAEFEARRAELERQAVERLAQAQAMAAQIEGITLQLVRKAGVMVACLGRSPTSMWPMSCSAWAIRWPKGRSLCLKGPLKALAKSRSRSTFIPMSAQRFGWLSLANNGWFIPPEQDQKGGFGSLFC